MTAREVLLDGGSPWGFRMNGGADVGHALRISRVNPGSKASQKGVREGDIISSINGQPTKCLTNGESHALLRTVGETLRLGLNQDNNGSPKRRSKEPLRRETSSSSTQSTPSTPVRGDAAPITPTASEVTSPSDQSEPTSAGAKVFVCGLWNSVNKTKERGKKGAKTEAPVKPVESSQERVAAQDMVPKTSSSKARRLRKLKLKNGKREEQHVSEIADQEDVGPLGKESSVREGDDEDDEIELVVVMEQEDIRKVGCTMPQNEEYPSERASETNSIVVEQKNNTSKTTKSKTKKKNGKSKGFSLSQIFTSKTDKVSNGCEDVKREIQNTTDTPSEQTYEGNSSKDTVPIEKSVRMIPAAVAEATSEIVKEILAENKKESKENSDLQFQPNTLNNEISTIFPKVSIKKSPILNPATTFTIIECETTPGHSTHETSTVENNYKTAVMCSTTTTSDTQIVENYDTNKKAVENSKNFETVKGYCDGLKNPKDDKGIKIIDNKENNKIQIFVVPPENVAVETEAPGVDWESVSNLDSKQQNNSSDIDEIRPETLVHLPSNDLQTSAVMKEGRNGIVQVNDYELCVQDLYSPFMAPEEEAKLRSFLETLNLTKPEEYDDTSSSKSYGDSSSTSISESSPIPPPYTDEIVVYRHVKSHMVPEPCYIPPRHQRHLDVITEETSDPSDSEKRQVVDRPWESSEMIRKNNEVETIPNDWYGSDEEPETTSDEGGIDLSWRDGRKLDDVEGVEVVYLSDDSDNEPSLNKDLIENVGVPLNKENLPELVVVHVIETDDVKNIVKLRRPKENVQKKIEDEVQHKKNAMEEIVAILDSTYEINKDLFMKQSSIEVQAKKPPTKIVECSTRITENQRNNQQQKPIAANEVDGYENPFINSSSAEDTIYLESSLKVPNNNGEDPSDELAVAQESLVAMTPPTLSRQGSSSSATSQSTAKYNPGQSPMSSEAEEKTENESSRKRKSKKKLYNPKSLTCLSKEVVTCLPHGEFYLNKIGFWNGDASETEVIGGNTEKQINVKLTSLPPSGISTRRSSYHELENIYSQPTRNNNYENEITSTRPVLLKSPPPSSLISPAPNDDPWVGLPTSTDRRLLVCLSPSQSKENTITSPKEVTELLELHKKFVERRGYHEQSKRNSICSPKSERSRTPDFSSPDLIRLEPYEAKEAQVYTPELLIEAANLLALKEYRQCRFKRGQQSNTPKTSDSTGSVKLNVDILEKPDSLTEVTSPRTEINADSEGPDSNRSAGTSRLLALLQDGGVQCSSPNNTVPSEMDRVDKSGPQADRAHRYTGSYISEWLTMAENVTSSRGSFSDTDHNENVINSEECVNNRVPGPEKDKPEGETEKRQFDADKYKISKQGDIAIIQSAEESAVQRSVRGERPKSLPAVGVPALTPSGGELFREQMYHEYMNKVAERTERRQQKVIKISNRPVSAHSKPEAEGEQNAPVNRLESEFIVKARERMSKLGISLDEERTSETVEEMRPEELPRHLQEFIELTAAPLADPAQDAPTGVWSPGATPEPQRKQFNFSAAKEETQPTEDQEPQPAVWTPKSAQASPTSERKTFRPVSFESPKLGRKVTSQKSSEEAPKPPTDLPLSLDSPSHSHSSSVSSSTQYVSSRETVTTQSLSQSQSQETSGRLVTSHSLPDTSLDNKLPRAQNPTITLLQKAREGQLPRGAHYLEQNSHEKRSSPPAVRPNEVLYPIRREYDIETEDKQPKKIVDLGPKKYDGIGPTTKEGIPIVLRSEVQDENQQKWYKRMYDSLHRAERDKEYVTVRYKTRRGRYPYTSSAGYLSEPEPLGGYDSDYTTAKYATLDRRRIRNKENDFTTSTMPRSKYNAVKHGVDIYKNQPGRIEDYEPGHSSIADKETKQWWDEVMDIFDGQFEQTQKSSPRTHAPTTTSTNKPFMTYALKESGYESDSTLVFKRRDETQQELSPAEQKLAYKTIQKGGDVPLHGLRKPVPEKPKGPDDSEIEYFPISPHLTRIRIHKTKQVIKPVNEVICYPITNITVDNPPPIFSSYKRTAKTSSELVPQTRAYTSRPPSPPKRRSSHNSSTLRLYSKMSISPSPKKSRLGRSLSCGVEVDSNVQYLKDRITSKLGVGLESSADKGKKKDTVTSYTKIGKSNRYVPRTSSLSPSLHTTVTTTPSGVARVTKKTTLDRKTSSSLRSRKDLANPTRLAKSTELRAPAEVKKVLKQREVKERSSSSKSLPPGTVVKSSTALYSSSRASNKTKEDKQLKITVAISAKGRELLRSSSVSSSPILKDTSVISKRTETTTTTADTVPTTSIPPPVPKSISPRPPSRSDSDKRPSSHSTSRDSPVERNISSPVAKTSTSPTVAVSPVPSTSNDLIKKPKNPDVSSEVPKKKREKNGMLSSKLVSLGKTVTTKKNVKDNDIESNGKKKSKKTKDGDSPITSKKSAKKNGIKKSRDQKKTCEKKGEATTSSARITPKKENKDYLAVVPFDKVSSKECSDIDSKLIPTKAFFQNLLLRNLSSPTPSNNSTLQRASSVFERAKIFHKIDGHSSLPFRSEPSLRLLNVYLNNKKPVTESKFRSLDREVTSNRSSRSQSPIYSINRRYEFLEKIDKFDRMNNVWDKAVGYYSPADSRSRSPDLLKERSSSEPPRASPTNEIDHVETFGNINNAHWDYENMSPTPSRSPSCRRIRSARTAVKTIESIGGLRQKGIRAKSLSEADGKKPFQSLQAQSTSSLNLSHLTDHSDYQTYVMELLHSTKKSDRFKELHKFYASLERMGELERTTSNTDLRPRKKGEEVIDYDRWKQLRTKERAEEELKTLYVKLKEDQKEKDLLFQPRDTEAIKWKGDRGLRSKEKSVEDLRQRFQKLAYEDSDIELCRRRAIDATKDVYKPLWRGSSVLNLANTIVSRKKRGRSVSEVDQTAASIPRPVGSRVSRSIGSRLWSSLSMEQVNALKNQLSEIYTTVSNLKRDRINKMLQGKPHTKEYEITVPSEESGKLELPGALHVRCNSLLTKEQLYSPLNRRKESQRNECKKADSISSIPNWGGSRDSFSGVGDSSHSHSPLPKPLSESEKKKLSMTLSQEVKNRVSKQYGEDKKKRKRISSSIVIPRETLGAVAAIKGNKKVSRMKSPSLSDSSPRTCYSIEMSEDGSISRQINGSSHGRDKGDFLLVLTPKDDDTQEVKKVVDEWAESKSQQRSPKDERVVARLVPTTSNSETDSGSSEASTVIHLGSREDVQKKVDYFEAKKEKDEAKELDGRVSRSVGDVRPFSQEIKHRAKSAPSALTGRKSKTNLVSSESCSDLKELFGEKRASVYATTPLRKVAESQNNKLDDGKRSDRQLHTEVSGLQSSEESIPIRSRSVSPDPMKYYRAYLNMVKAGDVRKLRDKYESLDDLYAITDEEIPSAPSPPPKRYQSDPDLTREFFDRKGPEVTKTVVKGQEVGDVKWLKKRYEREQQRGRSKIRKVVSPVPLKSENRFMPHINVISKLAALQQQRSLTAPARPEPCVFRTGEVDRLRQQFEDQQRELSLLGQMFTSTPDVRELRDIAPYLECNWVAHQYPKPRSLSSPETQRSLTYSPKPRPASSSPVRRQTASILKPQQKKQRDAFANQHFDPSIHRPLYRYQPPSPCVDTSYHYRPWTKDPHWWWRQLYPSAKPTVTFKEPVRGRVAVPQRGSYPSRRRPESPHRYVESEVTIHYRSPVRSEEKEAWSEEELQRRQAEAMRRIYQEERRRKYLQELQDMYSRRHTDNFTPSQKSPIPLNRYDDFVDDLSPGKPRDRTPEPKLVARALYNFIGQTSRELTFRRGDIIYVRRQIDKNWYEGEHNAMIGLFPFNYVEIIPYDGIRTIPKRPTEGQARAKFNFQAQTHLELPLVKGELVLLTRRVDNNWFEGRIGTRKGIFPVSYVDVLVEPGERAMSPVRVNTPTKPVASPAAHSLHVSNNMNQHHYQPPRPVSYTSLPRQKTADLKQPPVNQTLHIDTQNEPVPYRVLYNYKPQNEDELELVEGETVYVMEKCDDGWYVGSSQCTGYLGTFPGNYVERQV